MKHVVEVVEYLVRNVIVEADTVEEAESKVMEAYVNGEIELDYRDFDETEFEYLREATDDDIERYMDI